MLMKAKINFMHNELGMYEYIKGNVYDFDLTPQVEKFIRCGYLEVIKEESPVIAPNEVIEVKEEKIDKRTKEYKAKIKTK